MSETISEPSVVCALLAIAVPKPFEANSSRKCDNVKLRGIRVIEPIRSFVLRTPITSSQ